jgi:hypothetical protein
VPTPPESKQHLVEVDLLRAVVPGSAAGKIQQLERLAVALAEQLSTPNASAQRPAKPVRWSRLFGGPPSCFCLKLQDAVD